MSIVKLFVIFKEKSNTCKEGGPQLRISFWYLLMNLKNKQLLKKITQMRKRWGTPQNFFLTFIEELEKQIII